MRNIDINSALTFEPSAGLFNRFCVEQNVSIDEARARFLETKKFLILCAADRNRKYSPSSKIDAMWHQFILHSKDYFMFCNKVGGYIHHQPSEKIKLTSSKKTLEVLKTMFNDIDEIYWEQETASCCSGCSN